MNRTAILLTSVSLLAACTNDKAAHSKFNALSSQISDSEPTNARSIQRSDRIYLGTAEIDDSHGDPLPDQVETANGFAISYATGTLSIDELARKITRYTQIPVILEHADKPESVPTRPRSAAKGAAADIDELLGDRADTPAANTPRTPVQFQGPLSDFLERTVPTYGLDWDYRGGVIHIASTVIRSYPVVDMPSTTTISAGLSGSAGGTQSGGTGTGGSAGLTSATPTSQAGTGTSTTGATGSGGGQNTTTTTSIKGWDDVLSTLAGYAGGKENVFPEASNGRVAVRCSRYCAGLVGAYIREHNNAVGRSVLITVAILTLQKTGSDDYGFSPSVLYNNLPTGYSLSVIGQTSAVAQAQGGVITGGIVNPPAGSTAAKWNGTSLAVQALSQDQEVTGSFQKYCFTGNNRVCSIRNALDYSFPTSFVNSANTISSTSGVTISTIVIGDQLQIIPRIVPGGMIRLQLAVSRTALQGQPDTVTINGTTTKIPQVTDNSSSPQEFTMQDGATLLLSDIGDDSSSRTLSGAGSVYNWLAGGSANANVSHDKTILIVTAREWHPGDPRPDGAASR